MGIDLPEFVLEDPVIVALSNASNDLVAYVLLYSGVRRSNVC